MVQDLQLLVFRVQVLGDCCTKSPANARTRKSGSKASGPHAILKMGAV